LTLFHPNMQTTKGKATPKHQEAEMQEDEDATFTVFDQDAGQDNRRPTKNELEQLASLGYPVAEKNDWYMKISNSDKNPGRAYWSYKFLFSGWVDQMKRYNKEQVDKALIKKERSYKKYCITQGLPLPEDLDVPKAVPQDIQDLRHELEELKKEVIMLRTDVAKLKNDRGPSSVFRNLSKPPVSK
jgi:hypothetical protein